MYSQRIRSVLQSKGLKAGDRVVVQKGEKKYEGMLMPRPDVGDTDSLIIKLDSGYNIGVSYEKGTKISKSKTKEPKSVKSEAEYELGRSTKKILKTKFDPKKPKVSMIATGGTISSRVDYRTGGVTAIEDPKEFLHNVPELAEVANIRISSPFTIMSESITYKSWQDLAKEVSKHLKKSKGVMITHGTDTLHFTSAALSFFLQDLNKPVVLVGAQRSSDRGSSDAGMNLLCATHTALSDMAEVGICMHGSIMDDFCLFTKGTKVRKMDTQRRDAFRPINDLPLARVYPSGKIEKINKNIRSRSKGRVKLDTKFEPKVAIVKSYPGCDSRIIDHYVDDGYKGLVLEATGLGQFPTTGKVSWLNSIKNAVDSGVFVCATPETIYGRLNPNVYAEGRMAREQGVVYLEDMLTETAYIKLGWVLGHTKDSKKAKEMMLKNYAGEITERTLPDTFLY